MKVKLLYFAMFDGKRLNDTEAETAEACAAKLAGTGRGAGFYPIAPFAVLDEAVQTSLDFSPPVVTPPVVTGSKPKK